ncbi:MAG: helix-turn-helix domain-containing protein [Bacteroidales bacterium]|nr:helix-turn-helix domain-containing protein [Bacteroidales bacterium]
MQEKLSKNAIVSIIDRLRVYYEVDTDTSLASCLGVRQNTISSWRSRGAIDFDLIIAKCDNINLNWLIFEEGPVYRRDINPNIPSNQSDGLNSMFLKQTISEKEEKIESLNREIGKLQNQIELLKDSNPKLEFHEAAEGKLAYVQPKGKKKTAK